VATFYRWFSLKPRGKHLLTCCMGTACHVRGAPRIDEELRRQLDTKVGETTEDREITYETQNCLGGCALGPIVVVDGHYFSNVTPGAVAGIIGQTREGLDSVDVKTDARIFPVEVSCARCNHNLMDATQLIDDHPSIRVTISWESAALLPPPLRPTIGRARIPAGSVADFFCPLQRMPHRAAAAPTGAPTIR
jgi:(2Fe-2S) ferredoxin